MYQYDDWDQAIVDQRSQEFRAQVERRVAGKISEAEFKPLRLMNGLYLQLHAYMLRVAIPYGVISSTQMHAMANISEQYDRGYGHFTTRQNIQFNWPKLAETPDILDALAKVQMHAIQTSGNCIRNITSDPYAGVAIDEAVDPRPLCELLRQWSTLHPEFAYLPRKFKFAVTGAANDRAAIKVHDIGLQLKKGIDGRALVDVWLGGGQGRTPKIAQLFKQNIDIENLLPYLEAIMRVYNRHGRRDNKYKARIKILLAETGLEALQKQVEEEFAQIDRTKYISAENELERISRRFITPDYARIDVKAAEAQLQTERGRRAEFNDWCASNVKQHRTPGYAIAVISLKPAGGVPGDASAAQMRTVADLARDYSHQEIRVTHRQNLVLPHVRKDQLFALWTALTKAELAEANIGMPSDIIACPGMDYCALATARSIPIAQSLSKHLRDKEKAQDLSDISINISGCINACAHHHVADIGILGLDRAGTENYQITLRGRNDQNASIGERMGPGLAGDELPNAVERVIDLYLHNRQPGERFSDAYDRLGKPQFKDAVYGKPEFKASA